MQPLDVHGDFGPQRTLDLDRALDHLAEPGHFGVGEVAHPRVRADAGLRRGAGCWSDDRCRRCTSGRSRRAFRAEGPRLQFAPYQPCRCLCLGLRLQMIRDHALPLDDLAVLADRLDTRTNLHAQLPETGLEISSPIYSGSRSDARQTIIRRCVAPSGSRFPLKAHSSAGPTGSGCRPFRGRDTAGSTGRFPSTKWSPEPRRPTPQPLHNHADMTPGARSPGCGEPGLMEPRRGAGPEVWGSAR